MNAHFLTLKFDHYRLNEQQTDKAPCSRDSRTENIATPMLWLGYVLTVYKVYKHRPTLTVQAYCMTSDHDGKITN